MACFEVEVRVHTPDLKRGWGFVIFKTKEYCNDFLTAKELAILRTNKAFENQELEPLILSVAILEA